jgi:predicted dithiol-disulfide oxidoreductase (DUF899 family)
MPALATTLQPATGTQEKSMDPTKIVSREEWLAARTALLGKEKEFTRLRDRLSAERRALPWVRVEKEYVFDTLDGRKRLAELFDGRSQLVVNHFMLGPGWKEGCVGCSFGADHMSCLVHLEHHDVTVVVVSRAPLHEIEAYRKRMGWNFTWVSSYDSDFNYDYHVSFTPEELAKGKVYYNYRMIDGGMDELPGLSVFYKDEAGNVFHTYSSYARGAEELLTTYIVLDMTPKGRNETGPRGNLTDWVRRHDEYDDVKNTHSCCAE